METNNKNKFIVVSYALYDVTNGDNGEEMLIERTTDERPFIFISGMGVTLPAFEEKVVDLAKGDEFDFQLDPEQAYGQHYDERVLELDKQIFTINGQFDAQHVQVGAIIPLQNEDGNHFNAVVKNISDTKVTCDLNHPLAGLKLNFCGQILESREATAEEIAKMAQMISGEGGGCSGLEAGGYCCPVIFASAERLTAEAGTAPGGAVTFWSCPKSHQKCALNTSGGTHCATASLRSDNRRKSVRKRCVRHIAALVPGAFVELGWVTHAHCTFLRG